MTILILAVGSRGDIQPYVALARGLKAAGHTVRILTSSEFQGLVVSYGLDCVTVNLSVQDRLQSAKAREAIEGGSVFASFREFALMARDGAELLAAKGLEAGKGADLIIAGFGGLFMGSALAERLGIRLIQAYNVPLSSTGDFAGALFPLSRAPRSVNRMTHLLTRELVWQTARLSGERARREVLGLGPSRMAGAFGREALSVKPVLYGISGSVIPRPVDWEEGLEMTGYWFLDRQEDWRPPQDLEDFLAAGPAPVYIGFGSMSHDDPQATTALVLEAIRLAGCRAVLSSGWGGLKPEALPEGLYLAGDLPHDWLFPRMAAVVHHGGAGTTAAGIRSGLPSVIVPFHGDQPFWGRRVAALGVGPSPLPRRRLSASRLAEAIGFAVGNSELRQRAAALGAAVRGEDGVARAVRLLSQVDCLPAFR